MTDESKNKHRHLTDAEEQLFRDNEVPEEVIDSVDQIYRWESMSPAERLGRQALGIIIIALLVLGSLFIIGIVAGY